MNDPNSPDLTVDPAGNPIRQTDNQASEHPLRIGRYRVEKVVGQGGFGVVYLAYDEQLNRRVAVKVPHAKRISTPADAHAYLAEARTVANLDHPGIVPVHDVGSSEKCLCYIVSKYIEGVDLSTRLKHQRLHFREAAELVATVAEALHYAHTQGLVHRDVKPANILIGKDGRPHVVDFGLALREENIGKDRNQVGTPAYMSPEQARGEGHRVDGRSDVFSLGVVFYELLSGRRPFRGDSQAELLEQVNNLEARPLRQYDEKLPKELERVCHKAMAKRASERYSSAYDMADDLRHFLQQTLILKSVSGGISESSISDSSPTALVRASVDIPVSPVALAGNPSSDLSSNRIVPKGLRSFDSHDADFFLELLPGPRDREGLPDSLRFWKTRIQETNPDNTFTVGLIYGPSGCGKSSLVKAGLLPRLADDVIAIYVEATADETESRLLHRLRKSCPGLNDNLSLQDTIAALRRGAGVPTGKKVLIVIDQFEQWLHARAIGHNTELVHVLRQCDGGRVQCIVMVRDDFWLAVSRFMRDLEVRLVEGWNIALADLFDVDHAEKVLAEFGRAFGKLPERRSKIDAGQAEFLKKSVKGLAEEGKIICVRLALFAEMMKGKAWTPATLNDVGGTEGVGVTFLEEAFCASTASPEHRLHEKAARAVLTALLPDSGSDIKGQMKSYAALLEVSGYADRPRDFDDLIQILDNEVRLIAPTDPEGFENAGDRQDRGVSGPSMRYFQLTHDYLVPSLRDWLTRKQQESRRGRAELKLAERSALWNVKLERRYLPSLIEWLSIRILTESRHWTSPQRVMMSRAAKFHVLRTATAAGFLVSVLLIGFRINKTHHDRQEKLIAQKKEEQNQAEATRLVEGLLAANTSQVSARLESLADFRTWAEPQLQLAFQNSPPDSDARLHSGLALLMKGKAVNPVVLQFLQQRMLSVSPMQFAPVCELLEPHKADLIPGLWKLASDDTGSLPRRFRAACALATFDPDSPAWRDKTFSEMLASQLIAVSPEYIGEFKELFRPVAPHLVAALGDIFKDTSRGELAKTLAITLLTDYASEDVATLTDLVLAANATADQLIFPILQRHRVAAVQNLEAILARQLKSDWHDSRLDNALVEPSIAVRAHIELARGLITERFAFCQAMSLEQFREVSESLSLSGYLPARIRLYRSSIPSETNDRGGTERGQTTSAVRDGFSTYVAAIWNRGNRRWHLDRTLSKAELPAPDAPAAKDGLLLDDVACIPSTDESAVPHFMAVWSAPTNIDEQRRVLLDVSAEELATAKIRLSQQGFISQCMLAVRTDTRGQHRYTAIWSNQGAPSEFLTGYSGFERADLPQWDIAVTSELPLDPLASFREQLRQINSLLSETPDDPEVLQNRAVVQYQLGDLEAAVADLDFLLSHDFTSATVLMFHALTQARLGKTEEANASMAKFIATDAASSLKSYAQILVPAFQGDFKQAWDGLDSSINGPDQSIDNLYCLARAAAVCSKFSLSHDPALSAKFVNCGIDLLQRAITLGYRNVEQIAGDIDLESLHADGRFTEILSQLQAAARYAGVWRADEEFESRLLSAVPVESVINQIRPLLAEGYRPIAIAIQPPGLSAEFTPRGSAKIATAAAADPKRATAADDPRDTSEISAGGPETTGLCSLVFHRPLVPDAEKETLAQEQAAAATALLRLNAAEKVWPLFQDQSDPRVRSCVLHRLATYRIDPQTLLTQIQLEKDVSRQRALIQGIGEFALTGLLSRTQQEKVITDLVKRYAEDPDSGVHSVTEWTLRKLGADELVAKVQAAYSTGSAVGDRRWFVTKTGAVNSGAVPITFAIISPEKEFLMGSPVSERDRTQGSTSKNELRHRRRIDHKFAVSINEITVAQFKEFRSDHQCDRKKAREENAPVNMVSWYDAAAYCNWLSKDQGIPQEQWCYDPDQEFSDGMSLFSDSIQRTGYRLLSEAEWEYGCRGGTTTARYFGETETLLAEYGWYTKTSADLWLLPVGTLRPNPIGLFDMHGNVLEWCQDASTLYPTNLLWTGDTVQPGTLNDSQTRVLRGGSFIDRAADVRSAVRNDLPPFVGYYGTGFRVARTCP